MRQSIGQRQHLEGLLAILEVDGSAVTTAFAQAGLLSGLHIADVKKGAGADSNLVTVQFKFPFGMNPKAFYQAITLNCVPRTETTALNSIAIRTLQNDLATKADDCDFLIFVYGTEGIREGKY